MGEECRLDKVERVVAWVSKSMRAEFQKQVGVRKQWGREQQEVVSTPTERALRICNLMMRKYAASGCKTTCALRRLARELGGREVVVGSIEGGKWVQERGVLEDREGGTIPLKN